MGIAAMLGSPIKRREDPRLITGQATYVDDIKLYGMLHLAVLRSPYGHARINSVNVDAARNLPGVVVIGGGIIVQSSGALVGAVGVSGAPGGDADDLCAKAGIDVIRDKLDF